MAFCIELLAIMLDEKSVFSPEDFAFVNQLWSENFKEAQRFRFCDKISPFIMFQSFCTISTLIGA
jgi:hypothetical protein